MLENILEFVCGFSDIIFHKDKENKQEFYSKEIKPHAFSFRPQTLDQYIGQERAKELVNLTLEKIRTIKPCHILITGTKGHGKSTLAQIIANQLDFDITYHVGGNFTMEALKDFLVENADKQKPQILFIDEIHLLDKKLGEFMYPLLEDFILTGSKTTKIRPFIFIGATTEKFTLLKKFSPLVDRCGADIMLDTYTVDDMIKILKQYNDQVYCKNIDEEIYSLIAKNCRYTPRIALSMFDDFIVCQSSIKVLNSRRIVRDSLTTIDINILEHLKEIDKPVGEEALSIIAKVNKSDYKLWYEPMLMQEGYITRTSRGRVITAKGKLILQEIEQNG